MRQGASSKKNFSKVPSMMATLPKSYQMAKESSLNNASDKTTIKFSNSYKRYLKKTKLKNTALETMIGVEGNKIVETKTSFF